MIAPNKYLVRIWAPEGSRELRVMAFSAEDAHFQVELQLKFSLPIRETVMYVGPVNPDCKCLNECRCGVAAQ